MHTTADDPTKYRSEEEVEAWKMKDPISRSRNILQRRSSGTTTWRSEMQEEQKKKIDEAVEKAEQFKPDPKSMFEHVYSYMPDVLKEELDDALAPNFYEEMI